MSTNSRRDFLTTAAAGLAGAALSPASEAISAQVGGTRLTPGPNPQGLIGDGRKRRILLRGGVVLTLDPADSDEDVKQTAAALQALGSAQELPAMRTFLPIVVR